MNICPIIAKYIMLVFVLDGYYQADGINLVKYPTAFYRYNDCDFKCLDIKTDYAGIGCICIKIDMLNCKNK